MYEYYTMYGFILRHPYTTCYIYTRKFSKATKNNLLFDQQKYFRVKNL